MKAQRTDNFEPTSSRSGCRPAGALATLIAFAVLQSGCAMAPSEDGAEMVAEGVESSQVAEAAAKVPAAEQAAPVAVKTTKAEVKKSVKTVTPTTQATPSSAATQAKVKTVASTAEDKVSEPSQEKLQEAQADAMMSSLAAKDKYAVITEEAPPKVEAVVVKKKPSAKQAEVTAVVAKKSKVAAKKSTPRAGKKLVKKPLNVSLNDLPVTIELWSIARNPNNDEIHITTPTWQMGDGSYLSQVWITLKEDKMIVNSSSDIDAGNNGSGVSLNGGELMPFTRIDDNTMAILEGDWMERLSNGGKLEIFMGFFPGKTPRSPTFKSDAKLDALSRLVPTYHNLTE